MRGVTLATTITLYSSGLGFVAVPIVALLLGVEEFGRSVLIQALSLWISFACTLGLPSQIRREIARGETGKSSIPLTVFGARYVVQVLAITTLLCGAVLIWGLLTWTELVFVILYFCIHSLFALDLCVDTGQRKFVRFAWKQSVYITVASLGAIALVALAGPNWEYRIIPQIVGLAIPLVFVHQNVTTLLPRRLSDFGPDVFDFKSSFLISIHGAVDKSFQNLDKVVIQLLFDDAVLGMYGFATSLASGLNVLLKVPASWYEQNVMRSSDNAVVDKLFLQFSAGLAAVAALGCAAVWAIPDAWLKADFLAGFPIVKTLIMSGVVYVLTRLFFAGTFCRYLRLNAEQSILKFDFAILVFGLGGATTAAALLNAEAFLLTASAVFLVAGILAAGETRGLAKTHAMPGRAS